MNKLTFTGRCQVEISRQLFIDLDSNIGAMVKINNFYWLKLSQWKLGAKFQPCSNSGPKMSFK